MTTGMTAGRNGIVRLIFVVVVFTLDLPALLRLGELLRPVHRGSA